MVIQLTPELESALNDAARQQGIPPDVLANNVLREQLLVGHPTETPRDEWERSLLDLATDCGISLPNWAVSSEGLYE